MDKGSNCNSNHCSAGSGNKRTPKVRSKINTGTVESKKTQIYGYDGTSYCKNSGRNEDKSECIADMKECKYYCVKMRRKDGTSVGICKKRYERAKKRQQRLI